MQIKDAYILWYTKPNGKTERSSSALNHFGTFNNVANLLHEAAGVDAGEAEQFAADARDQWDTDHTVRVEHSSGWSFRLDRTQVTMPFPSYRVDDMMEG